MLKILQQVREEALHRVYITLALWLQRKIEVSLAGFITASQLNSSMYWVYIITNKSRQVFYTGYTNDLSRRLYEHRNKLYPGFTAKYNCYLLLYFEQIEGLEEAKHRERQIKRYKREWKKNLIDSINPEWNDLTHLFPFE